MFSHSTALLLVSAALTLPTLTSGSPVLRTRDTITTTVRGLGVSDNVGYAGFYACGTVTGAVVPTARNTWVPACPSIYTITGSDSTGYTVATANGPCGFVNGVFACGAGVQQAHFDGGSVRGSVTPETAIYTGGGWSWSDKTLFEDKTVAYPVTIKLATFPKPL